MSSLFYNTFSPIISPIIVSMLCSFSFKKLYDQLRGLKTEIEHVQHLLERAKVQLQKDFEEWWSQHTTGGEHKVKTMTPY